MLVEKTLHWSAGSTRPLVIPWAVPAGDSISSVAVEVIGATLDSDSTSGDETTVWISGGIAGTTASCRLTPTLASGMIAPRAIVIHYH